METEKAGLKNIFLCRAVLKNFRFVYDGFSIGRQSPVADIIESSGDVVWGGLYEITEEDLKKLDRKEGFPKSYQRNIFKVSDDNGNSQNAIAYFREGAALGEPADAYRKIVLAGAADCKLPQEYIDRYIKN
jgi:gamma-glutamylcyclotransferase